VNVQAFYTRETGFRDDHRDPEPVTILGFVYGEYEPGYKVSGSKRCTLAVVAGRDGRIFEAELRHLRVPPKSQESGETG